MKRCIIAEALIFTVEQCGRLLVLDVTADLPHGAIGIELDPTGIHIADWI
jgi:hypothetical protein